MFCRLILWLIRLFAWPWAVRICERWPAAPREVTAGRTQQPMTGKAPRAKGARMDRHGHFMLQGGITSPCL